MNNIEKLEQERKTIEDAIKIMGNRPKQSYEVYDGLKEELAKIGAEIEKLKEKHPWSPEIGETYFTPNCAFESGIYEYIYKDNYDKEVDERVFKFGWQCKTESEAKYYFEKFTLIKAIDDWEKLNNPEGWDWEKAEKVYGLDYRTYKKALKIDSYQTNLPQYGKLATEELAEQFLTEFGDRIIKYLVKGV